MATIKPKEITNFIIQPAEREWKEKWKNNALQMSYLHHATSPNPRKRRSVQKVPYHYYYEFLTKGDDSPGKLKREDWEVGALFWNCLRHTDGNETQTNQPVKKIFL